MSSMNPVVTQEAQLQSLLLQSMEDQANYSERSAVQAASLRDAQSEFNAALETRFEALTQIINALGQRVFQLEAQIAETHAVDKRIIAELQADNQRFLQAEEQSKKITDYFNSKKVHGYVNRSEQMQKFLTAFKAGDEHGCICVVRYTFKGSNTDEEITSFLRELQN